MHLLVSSVALAQTATLTDTTPGMASADGSIGVSEYPASTTGVGNGFGNVLGTESTVFLDSDVSGSVVLGLRKGSGAFNDMVVVYIDSVPGGFAGTSTFTDHGDAHRSAVTGSEKNGATARLTFAPGFEADYAIALDPSFAGAWALTTGSHTYVRTLALSNSGNDYEWAGLQLSDLGLQPGDSFRYFATYLNEQTAWRSDEFHGVAATTVVSGNPGNTDTALANDDYAVFLSFSSLDTGSAADTGDTDADSDTDTDSDTDADSDSDSLVDTDADSDSDADTDTDSDSPADSDADSDASDTDTDPSPDTDDTGSAASSGPVVIVDPDPALASGDGTVDPSEYPGFSQGIHSGFGDVIGETSRLYVDSSGGGALMLGLVEGPGDFNDVVVVYIDSVAGGFSSTLGLSDDVDLHRAAVSGLGATTTDWSELNFASGFEADYAIAWTPTYAGLWKIESTSHTFVNSLSFANGPLKQHEVSGFTLADLGLSPGDSFDYLATYINGENAFRSDEFHGVSATTLPAGNPGNDPGTVNLAPGDFNTFMSASAPSDTSAPADTGESDADTDSDSDSDTDSDSDSDSDTDADSDSDADSDADSDSDGDSDADGDSDGDSDADGDADGDSDADADGDSDADADEDTDTAKDGGCSCASGTERGSYLALGLTLLTVRRSRGRSRRP